MNLHVFTQLESEVRGYVRAFPAVFSHARGAELHDESGRVYLDFFAGAGALNYGHNHPLLKQAALDYLASDGVIHGLDMATSAKRRFLQTFDQLILQPRALRYKFQFTGPTGTNAVEAAIKLARNYTGRSRIVSFTGGFHGVTQGALACTANSKFREAAGLPAGPHVTFMPYDGYLGGGVNTLQLLHKMMHDDSSGLDLPAAVIVECVQGEGGINVASAAWLRQLSALCREQNVLLIVDEIQTGCGRTGPFFSFEHAGIEPDIITLSKSLSGLGLPMAMLLLRPELDIWEPGQHNGTFRGHNLAFVTATRALELFWQDDGLQQLVRAHAQTVEQHLQSLCHRYPGQLQQRGRGLLQGLAFTDPQAAASTARTAFESGLIIEGCGPADEVLKVAPPLNIRREQLLEGLQRLEKAVTRVLTARPLLAAAEVRK